MVWIPEFKLGWLNGWIPLVLLALVDGTLFLLFPKAAVKRLFDRSGWSQRQVLFTVLGKLMVLICLLSLIFSPLKLNAAVFPVGMLLVLLGLVGVAVALFNFKNTTMDQPVSKGFYSISRHPQIVMATLVLLGACVAVGSWSALLLLLLARVLAHFSILAEEEVCIKNYGDSYREYMERVPRYFIFF